MGQFQQFVFVVHNAPRQQTVQPSWDSFKFPWGRRCAPGRHQGGFKKIIVIVGIVCEPNLGLGFRVAADVEEPLQGSSVRSGFHVYS